MYICTFYVAFTDFMFKFASFALKVVKPFILTSMWTFITLPDYTEKTRWCSQDKFLLYNKFRSR